MLFAIARNVLEQEVRKSGAKTEQGTQCVAVWKGFHLCLLNLQEYLRELKKYDLAQWALGTDRWLSNLLAENTKSYVRGDIVYLDLGSQNFSHEPSYTHASIILKNKYNTVLIVPCSSKQYQSGHPGIIDATPADGFRINCGVQVSAYRWVHKNRIVSVTSGKASSALLDKIDEAMLKDIPTHKKQVREMQAEIAALKAEIAQLKEQNSDKG